MKIPVRLIATLPPLLILGGLAVQFDAHRATIEQAELLAQNFHVSSEAIRNALIVGGLLLLACLAFSLRDLRREALGVEAPYRNPWLAFRWLFVAATLGLGLYVGFLQPFRKPTFDVALALLFGVWALGLLIVRWVPTIAGLRGFRVLDVMLFNLCLTAILVEAALRIAAYVSPSPLLVQDDVRATELMRAKAQQQQPGQLRFGFPFNTQGYYDTDFTNPSPTGKRIGSIGDSFSIGVVPHYFHFTTVVERQLSAFGVEVENFGYPAIGPFEYLHLLRTDVLPRKPDLVAVNVFVGNDLSEAKRLEIEHPILRLWLDRDNLLVYKVPQRLTLLQRARGAGAPEITGGKIALGSVAGEDSAERLNTPEALTSAYPWLADSTREEPSFPLPGVYLHIEAERAQEICDPELIDPGALFASLRIMRRLTGSTPFVVHLLPDDFQLDDQLWHDILEHTGRTDLVRELPQQLIVPWLESEEIPYLDLLPIFRQQCADHQGDSHCYHRWDSHFNARGNRLAGEAMARFLAPHLGF